MGKKVTFFVALTCFLLLCGKITYAADSGDLSLDKPSKGEIIQQYDNYQNNTCSEKYLEEPQYSNGVYNKGIANPKYLERACTYLNYIRYVAGLKSVSLNADANESAQYGATLLAANNVLTHYPTKPDDMSEDFYQKGRAATTSSNLGYASNGANLIQHISGCMSDRDSHNITCVGHRRWLLNPKMSIVGFGLAGDYTATKVFGFSDSSVNNQNVDYDFISWPSSGNCPDNLFRITDPWSVTLNPNKYQKPDISQIQVEIRRVSDGMVWIMNSSDYTDSPSTSKDYLTVNNDGYGVSNCIIFRPQKDELPDSVFEGLYSVKVSGIYDKTGNETRIEYSVDFFNINEYKESGDSEADRMDYSLVFDAAYYYNNNPDVAAVLGSDEAVLKEHFINFGMAEGREASENFSVKAYRYYNEDLQAAFGEDWKQYYLHYVNCGKTEQRRTTGLIVNNMDYSLVFNAAYYYNNNPDVAAAYGNSEKNLFGHFINYGMAEGRISSQTFDVWAYKANNVDLKNAFGDQIVQYYQHYLTYGKDEGRVCIASETMYNGVDYAAVYDKEYYLSHNIDVADAFNGDTVATISHFVNYGMREGRQAIEGFNVNSYKNRYMDLQNAFGDNLEKYFIHYIQYGRLEGRNAN